MEMDPQKQEQQKTTPKTVPELMEIQPVDEAAAAQADKLLNSRTKQNGDLNIVAAKWATNPDLMKSPNFNFEKKLILAEVLKLVADSLDPEKRSNLDQDKLIKSRKQLKAAVNSGVGQMLERLRPMEILANQIALWKANSSDPKSSNLPKNQTSMLVGPNMLIKQNFQKIVEHEVKQSNHRISRGLYRTFMFLPFDKLEGETMSLIPYLRMAGDYHFHIMGSLPIDNSLDEMGRLKESWKYTLSAVNDEEQDILANATIVANELVVREPHKDFHEEEPLKCGLNYTFASAMTRYFQRKKDGHWDIPVLHSKMKPSDLKTVNTVDVLDSWRDAVSNQFNFAYTVSKPEDEAEAGVKIYGATTTFPEAEVDIDELGNQAVPKIQSQARITRNRIYFYLITQLERFIGGDIPEPEVRRTIGKYLEGMKSNKQIAGWKILECAKDPTGKYKVRLSIKWSATAREFEIDAESRSPEEDAA
jgi:hypothetical protein